ncbi:MAG: hypothetical protein PHV20_07335 [Bacteroidales bacterium]|nr:hypothetical protein [Bacteroidales bacterium]
MERIQKLTATISLLVSLFLFSGCDKTPPITNTMLDGEVLFDPSLYQPEFYLASYAHPTPSVAEKSKPILIASHGYSASTFEWNEFRDWSVGKGDYYLSQVLLGGHGRTYLDFKNATWHDWQTSITDEYERLVAKGYTNISFVGSSTGGTLLLELVSSGYFNGKVAPRHIFLVDPIVISSDKSLSLIGLVGPMLGYVEADNTTEEDKYWYHYRPQETLQQLMNVISKVRVDLEKGVTLPVGTSMKIYKSKHDATADAVSAVLIYRGVKTATAYKVDIDMVESNLHVFTRLLLRSNVSDADKQNQKAAFNDILNRVIE